MYHKQLVTHVSSKIQAGLSNEDIWKELKSDGWSDDDIKEAFYYVSFPDKQKNFSFKRLFHTEVPIEATVIILIVAIVSITGLSYAYGFKTLNYTINLPENLSQQKIQFSYGEQPALSDPDFFGRVKQQWRFTFESDHLYD